MEDLTTPQGNNGNSTDDQNMNEKSSQAESSHFSQTGGATSNAAQSQSGTSQTGIASDQNNLEEEYNLLKNELEENRKKLEEAESKLQEMMNISKHALADLQNFKRRSEEEKAQYVQYANAKILLDFIPAFNNIDRALKHEPKNEEWVKGVEQTLKQLFQILEKHEVKTIETIGKPFNPLLHEALMEGPGEKDIISEEFEKGYMMGEKVIKQARVKVGNGENSNE